MQNFYDQARAVKAAAGQVAILTTEQKNAALLEIAAALRDDMQAILAANQLDMEAGEQAGLSAALKDRLRLNEARIEGIAEGVEQVAGLPDPIGQISASWTRPNGLRIERVQVPLGVLGVIYEARPNVTVDCCALALKTDNAIVLRGSSSALHSNMALTATIHRALAKTAVPVEAVQLLEDTSSETAQNMMRANGYIDVLIPRGGANLIRTVMETATIPVLETGVGNCHIYIDASAKPEMAFPIVINSKTQRPSVCNAAESLLVHADWAKVHLPELLKRLHAMSVDLHTDAESAALCPQVEQIPATEADWGTEYLALAMSVKVVQDVDEAIAHINKYGTGHTEAIITEDAGNAAKFLQRIDAAAVMHNASTRLTDGFEFGFGADIGISTQKLHARGPLGPEQLTIYKYLVHGTGQIRR